MDWKESFDPGTLQTGLKYFKQGKVKGLKEDDNGNASAKVLGQRVHNVKVIGYGKGVVLGLCDCSVSRRGLFCNHTAAVCYALDFRNGVPILEEAQIEEYDPLKELFGDKPARKLFFDLRQITSKYDFDNKMISEARGLVNKGEAWLEEVLLGYDRYLINGKMKLYASASFKNKRFNRVDTFSMSIGREGIDQSYCSACGHNFYPTFFSRYSQSFCVHQVAFLMLLSAYIIKYNPGDETDINANKVLSEFKQIRSERMIDEEVSRTKTLSLIPKITRDSNSFALSFRIGSKKLNAVKNLSELVETYEKKGTVQYGSNLISFVNEDFADESLSVYDFIKERVKEINDINAQIRSNRYYYGEGIKIGNSIHLSGTAIDDFYDLFNGRNVEYIDKVKGNRKASELKLREREISFELSVSPYMGSDKSFNGVKVEGDMPAIIEGNKYRYFIQDSYLSRLGEESSRRLLPFMSIASNTGKVSFVVGEKNLAGFFYRVLPELKEGGEIEVNEINENLIHKNLPPEAHFLFLLDIEDGFIKCKPKVSYDESSFDLMMPDGDFPEEEFRDIQEERRVSNELLEIFPDYDKKEKEYSLVQSDDAVFDILDIGISKLLSMGEVQGTDAINRLKIRRTPTINIGVSVESDIMNLEVKTQDISQKELLDLLSSYRLKKRYHRLGNGDYVVFGDSERSSLDMLSSVMDSMNLSLKEFVEGKLHLPLYRALYLDKMLEDHDEIAADRDRHFRSLVKNFKTVKDSDYETPPTILPIMRKYQIYGYKWFRTLFQFGFGGILADDMGLGKTLQLISVILAQKNEGESGTALVVCPASLIYNWMEEIEKFAPSLNAAAIAGNLKNRKEILKTYSDYDVVVTSYDLLRRDIGLYDGLSFNLEVVDEAQYIKNPKTGIAKAVKVVKASKKAALTGTPIENRLSELWSIFDFLMPGFLYTYEQFSRMFETPITKNKDEDATESLKKMVSPFILRRLKGDVLKDLPDKIEEVRYSRFEEDQQRLYDAQVLHMKQMLEETEALSGEGRIKILAELTKIRQICCDPSLIFEDYKGSSAKKDSCIELVQSAIDGNHRILLFSQFTSMLALLEKSLKKEKIPYYKITGSTPKEERVSLVHDFNEGDVPLFLISLKAGGTGLNLVGADVVIHYDPWWNVAAQNQATDRAHRIGQTREVSVYRIIVKDTIEEKILKMQEAKKDLADAILSGETTSIAKMSKDELMELLS